MQYMHGLKHQTTVIWLKKKVHNNKNDVIHTQSMGTMVYIQCKCSSIIKITQFLMHDQSERNSAQKCVRIY